MPSINIIYWVMMLNHNLKKKTNNIFQLSFSNDLLTSLDFSVAASKAPIIADRKPDFSKQYKPAAVEPEKY